MSTKYNNGQPINIESLDKSELAQAFHEWAEGSEALEDLFYACHEQGIKTWASDAHIEPTYFTNRELGIEEDPDNIVEYPACPYISFVLDEKSEETMKSIYELLKDRKDVEMMMQLFSTGEVPSTFNIYTKPDNRDEIFSILSHNIREEKSKSVISSQFKKMKSVANIFKDVWYVQPEVINSTKIDMILMKLRVLKYKIMKKSREKLPQLFSRKNQKALPEPADLIMISKKDEERVEKNDEVEKKPSWELTPEQVDDFNSKAENIQESKKQGDSEKKQDIEENFHSNK